MIPVGGEALGVPPRGLAHRRVAHAQLLQQPLGLHHALRQRLRLGPVPLGPLVPLLLDVVPVDGLLRQVLPQPLLVLGVRRALPPRLLQLLLWYVNAITL